LTDPAAAARAVLAEESGWRPAGKNKPSANPPPTAYSVLDLFVFPGVIGFVYVFVERRKPDEERYTDQVFDPFYVLVIVDQGEYFFYLANR
jgi:hypothetical protein